MTQKISNVVSDFERCRRCIYFPDISVDSHPYYTDEYGVKHRDMKYICQYDFHEIHVNATGCRRAQHG